MLLVIPTCAKDREQAARLANWIKELGNVKKHQALLVLARGVNPAGIIEPLQAAFRNAAVMQLNDREPQPVELDLGNGNKSLSYARAANLMFRRAAIQIEAFGMKLKQDAIRYNQANPKARKEIPTPEPWLWLEPDAIPVDPDWLDVLESAYRAAHKPFMGARVNIPPAPEHMSGIAIYPWNAPAIAPLLVMSDLAAWDVNAAGETLPKMAETKLIQHEWRPSEEWPDLSRLRPGAVIYHQAKGPQIFAALRAAKGSPDKRPGVEPADTLASPPSVKVDSVSNAAQQVDSTNPVIEELRRTVADLQKQLARKRGKKMEKGRKRGGASTDQ